MNQLIKERYENKGLKEIKWFYSTGRWNNDFVSQDLSQDILVWSH